MGIRYFFLCKSLFSLGVVSSRYNIERHNFPRKLSLNVVNYLLPGFHRPVYTGRRRKSPRGRRLGGRENRRVGGDWEGKLVSIIVIKSAKEKSRENHKQTNKQTNEKGGGRGGLKFQGEKRVGKKNEHEICHMALRTCETIRLRFVDPTEFKVQNFLMSFSSRSIHNKKCMCR